MSSEGLDVDAKGISDLVVEDHVARSNALHARLGGQDMYLTGPLVSIRVELRPTVSASARGSGCRRPGRRFATTRSRASPCVRSSLCTRARRHCGSSRPTSRLTRRRSPFQGEPVSVTARPRHPAVCCSIVMSSTATVLSASARIVPPTSQNLLCIEDDLRRVAQANLSMPDEELGWLCEQTVRNYDPCISCATHFLDVTVERR